MERSSAKFQLIYDITHREGNVLKISELCKIAGVSRSGYYNWVRSFDRRLSKEEKDRSDFELILTAYQFRGYDKGIRGIHMRLLHMNPPIRMNIKKIKRLMRKYNLFCPIRKANPYRRMAKALRTDAVSDNLLNREFTKHGPRQVLLTDITYFPFEDTHVYLSVIMDAFTRQILSYVLSPSLEIDFVLETVNILIKKHEISLDTDTLIHSDQGAHYTSKKFRQLISDIGLRQSMSRRGNCWDNAPQESFFGKMKDYIGSKVEQCTSYCEISDIIDDWMDYYNNDKYQWQLAKLSPNEYYEYITTGVYPLPIYTPQ